MLENILLGLSIAASIGPVSLLIIKSVSTHQFWSGLRVAFGALGSDILRILLLGVGLSYLTTNTFLFAILYCIGIILLLFLAYDSWKVYKSKTVSLKTEEKVAGVAQGFIINGSNPMSFVWWAGFVASSLSGSTQLISAFGSALLVAISIFVGNCGYALLAKFGKRFLTPELVKKLNIVAALVFLYFAYGLLKKLLQLFTS